MNFLRTKSLVFLGSSLIMAGAGYADDTEIFFQPAGTGVVKPNILFVIDTSGSMSYGETFIPDGTFSTKTTSIETKSRRIQIVKDVLETILSETSGVNAGLMRFNREHGASIVYPIANIESTGAEQERGHGAVDGRLILRARAAIKERDDDANENTNGSGQVLNSNALYLTSGKVLGLRYQGLDVPRHAKITRAYIDFNLIARDPETGVSVGGTQSGSATIKISAHKVGDSPAISATNKLKPRLDSEATSSVTWPISGGWQAGESYRTVDFSSVVQQVVDQDDWCGGNAMTLMFQHTNGVSRTLISYENPYTVNSYYSPLPPVLVVEYDEAGTVAATATANTCLRGATAEQVAGAEDDAEQVSDGDVVLRNDADIDWRSDPASGSTNDIIGFRFREINIPQGADVDSAKLVLTANDNGAVNSAGTVYGVAADSASAFGAATGSLGALPLTGGTPVSLDQPFTKDSSYSIDVTAQVDAIVDRTGWAPGNNLALIVKGTAGDLQAYSYESSAGNAARLAVSYKLDGKPFMAGQVTKRQMVIAELRQLLSEGGTPTTEAFYESYLYFAGKDVDFGTERSDKTARGAHPLAYTGGGYNLPTNCPGYDSNSGQCSGEGATGSPTYISPVTDSCQKNVIVILSDGQPNSAQGIQNNIRDNTDPELSCATPSSGESFAGKDCAYKLASFVSGNTVDLSPTVNGNQNVQVHTIGFGIGEKPTSDSAPNKGAYDYLSKIAENGGGKFYNSQNATDLLTAFSSILSSLKDINSTFVSAGVTVNQFNRLTHLDELYFALFKPSSAPVWNGNLKRFRLNASDGLVYDDNGNKALNVITGQFENTSKSWWSGIADGNDVRKGGAASRMTNSRLVYTNLSGSNLTEDENRVSDANTAITTAKLNAVSSTERTKILNWAVGQDVNNPSAPTAARKTMGDPLHSQPVLVSYDNEGTSFNRVFMGANDGFLHNVDSGTGDEKWAFIPEDLLGSLKIFQSGSAFGPHPYGLDGPITTFLYNDVDKDGVVDVGTDTAYLYVGMRRGGRNYYALDISNPDAPTMLFTIKGGIAGDYAELGQTWSRMIPAKIKQGGDKQVVIFGGGYDTTQDSYGGTQVDGMGRTVFIADAKTGSRLWSAREHAGQQTGAAADPKTKLKYSFPGDVAAVDLTGSGYIEHLYVGDMGGQVFRFDMNKSAASASDTAKGGRLAYIQDSTDEVDNRRFYYAPDIVINERPGVYSHVAVSLGSGFREHPLDKVIEEHFYSLRDYGVLAESPVFDAVVPDIALNHLIDINQFNGDQKAVDPVTGAVSATPDGIGDAIQTLENDQALTSSTDAKRGWYLPFNGQNESIRKAGEKVLAQAVTVQGTIFFTSYYPTVASTSCEPSEGKSRLYSLQLTGGDTTKFLPDIEGVTAVGINQGDRFQDLTTPGIAPGLLVLSTGQGLRGLVGPEGVGPVGEGGSRFKVYKWRQREAN
ncbi:MAG: hypothetical protein HYV16_08685 [Gammaproteobacteria bacterium]|nr:hypothetical protein [Gammaproteobacteria bacterium]